MKCVLSNESLLQIQDIMHLTDKERGKKRIQLNMLHQ